MLVGRNKQESPRMARFVYTSSRAQQHHPIQDWTRFLRATRTFFPLHPGESHNIMLTLVQLMFSSSGTIRSSLLNSRYWSLHPAKVHLHPIPINNLSCTHTPAGCPWTCERGHPWNGDGVTNGTNAREECTSGKQVVPGLGDMYIIRWRTSHTVLSCPLPGAAP